jgi:hypothetical protein
MVTVEEFFKELLALAHLRTANKCTRKELKKVFRELLQPPKPTSGAVERAEKATAALAKAEKEKDHTPAEGEEEDMMNHNFGLFPFFLFLFFLMHFVLSSYPDSRSFI